MAKKLWQKGFENLNSVVEKFETAQDLVLDMYLVEEDILGSLAHATMLQKIGILTAAELKNLKIGLKSALSQYKKGAFKLEEGDEDIHTRIENYLTKSFGEVGKKFHTGRSRNDQVLVDIRLFTKKRLLQIWAKHLVLADTFAKKVKAYSDVPMPGYTHMQKAMPSSVGLWLESYLESLIDDLQLVESAFNLNDQSPLGAAAGYGTSLPLDRKQTAELLGFAKVQNNPLYTQNSRGKIESVVLFALLQIALDIAKFSSDLLLFTTSEFDYFELDKSFYSGSSIMPQKKNLDVAELLRSKVHVMEGYLNQVLNISKNLPSGYNRDLQDIKKPLFEGLILMPDILDVANLVVKSLKPKIDNLKASMSDELFATDAAYELVSGGMPFRDAYQKIGEEVQNGVFKYTSHGMVQKISVQNPLKELSKSHHKLEFAVKNFEKAKTKLLTK